MSRIVVIGGGVAGLATAARLARMRHAVTLVDRNSDVGGAIATRRIDGFTFDTGPSVVTLPAAVRDLFIKTGRPVEDVIQLAPLDPMAHVRFPDGTAVDVPAAGPHQVADAFGDTLGGAAADDWRRFVERSSATWESVRGPLLETPDGRLPLRLRLHRRSLRSATRRALRDPRLAAYVESFVVADGTDPRRAAAVTGLLGYVEHTFRPWRVVGGMHRLVEALHERAVERHVTVVTGATVEAVSSAGGRVDGVRLAGGQTITADVVVSTIDAAALAPLLPPEQAATTRAAPTSPSWFVLLLGLGQRAPLPARSLLLGDGSEIGDVYDAARPAREPAIHLWVAPEPDAAPAGGQAVTVAVRAPRHGPHDWSGSAAGDYAEHLLDRLAARGHDLHPHVVVRQFVSPADLEHRTGVPGGAVHGWASSARRPAATAAIPGLFLAGASTRPGGGLAPTLLSAAHVAERIGRA